MLKLVIQNERALLLMYKYEIIHLDFPMPFRIVDLDYPRLRSGKTSNEMHWHEEVEIIVSVKGEMITYINDKSFLIKEEDVFVINSNDIHCSKLLDNTSVYKGYCLQIGSQFLRQYCVNFEDIRFLNEFDTQSKNRVRNIIIDVINATQQNSLYSSIYIQAKLLELVYYLLLNSSKRVSDMHSIKRKIYKKRIDQVIEYITDNYNKDINAKSISEKFGISEGHLVKVFKDHIGITPKDYISNYRLKKAVNALISTDDSILDIALNHGFSNIKSFYVLFKKEYNMTPKEYRKLYMNK